MCVLESARKAGVVFFYNNTLLIRNTQGLPKNVGVLKMLGNDRPIFQKNHSKRHWNLILLKKCTILPFWAYNTSSTAMLQHWLVKIIQFFSSFSSSSSCLCYSIRRREISPHTACVFFYRVCTLCRHFPVARTLCVHAAATERYKIRRERDQKHNG